MNLFFQIVLMIVLLSLMIFILLGIGRLGDMESFEDKNKTNHLKVDCENDVEVVSENSVFNSLFNRNGKSFIKRQQDFMTQKQKVENKKDRKKDQDL